MEVPMVSPYEEETGMPPAQAWYTNGSTKGHPLTWVAVTIQPLQKEFWCKSKVGQSRQWAKLQVVWLVLTRRSGQNNMADTLVRACMFQKLPPVDMGPWLHKKLEYVGPRTMYKVAQRWHILLTFADANQEVQACAQCTHFYPHHRWVPIFQRD